MTWFFIAPLAIALVVTFLFKNAVDEVAYMAAAIVLVNLLVSLVVAPWQLKALLVILVIFTSQRFLKSLLENPVESKTDEKLTLTYRGANYEVTSASTETIDAELKGKYRGQSWTAHLAKTDGEVTPSIKYRGVGVQSEEVVVAVVQKDANLE